LQATGLGHVVPGYPDERYLDINLPLVVKLIEKRIQMCARRGFDAVEPDIDDSYSDATGFAISEAANAAYDTTLARYAHGLGLGFGLKNGDANGCARLMLPRVDFAVDEQCIQYHTCGAFEPAYRDARVAVLEAEYVGEGGPSPAQYCPGADAADLSAVQYRTTLDGSWRVACPNRRGGGHATARVASGTHRLAETQVRDSAARGPRIPNMPERDTRPGVGHDLTVPFARSGKCPDSDGLALFAQNVAGTPRHANARRYGVKPRSRTCITVGLPHSGDPEKGRSTAKVGTPIWPGIVSQCPLPGGMWHVAVGILGCVCPRVWGHVSRPCRSTSELSGTVKWPVE
jgi:hypothetical protein